MGLGEAIGHALLALLYPSRCAGCAEVIAHNTGAFCRACRLRIVRVHPPWCRRCGRPLSTPTGTCGRCRRQPPTFGCARAWAVYDLTAARSPLTRAIHAAKYGGDRALAAGLGVLLAAEAPLPARWYTMVVPVPLHPRQLRHRGFNQALLLARPVARRLAVPLHTGVLERRRATRPQVGLSGSQRVANVQGAFRSTAAVRRAAVLLIDDVFTTGATANACARALHAAGARLVDVCTLARTLHE